MSNLDNLTKRIEYGKPFMHKLSTYNIKDVVKVVEFIWEQSEDDFYRGKKELKEEYKNRIIKVIYNSKCNMESLEICWSFYSYVKVTLDSFGLCARYKEEHKYTEQDIINISWVLLEPIFEKHLFKK